jgi:hypothetical protein
MTFTDIVVVRALISIVKLATMDMKIVVLYFKTEKWLSLTPSSFENTVPTTYFPKALSVCHIHVLHSRCNVRFIRTQLHLPNPTNSAAVSKSYYGPCALQSLWSLFDHRHGIQTATVVPTREKPDRDVHKNPETMTPSVYFCPDAGDILRVRCVDRFSLDGHCGNKFPENVLRRKLPGLFPLLLYDLRLRHFDPVAGKVPLPLLLIA